ncbi:3'-5' exoribonuclease domain-containing protein [Rhodococcus tibetensis]|uniref:3'-5' exoribonuclease n=1 Tax=Rhodococcus tibetensis TaxID=2965064 RepID=A0ABT1QC67_9NOCA|nr:3'-5' exoribonuclease [Rhodococcus sp. FXJ9.536]MCQ4119864.1 3'-5' exoribonuclease [Rhodococcus sp. FXJ9.536]
MATRYFYDTEFLEDGMTIDLISIGIVAEDGREYYAVSSDLPIARIRKDDWLLRNVMTSLPVNEPQSLQRYVENSPNHHPRPSVSTLDVDRRDSRVKPEWVIANEVRDFLLAAHGVELWADYAAYDHVVLCQLWGRMIGLPTGIPMFTKDLQQRLSDLGNPRVPEQTAGLHNALDDARHVKAVVDYIEARP